MTPAPDDGVRLRRRAGWTGRGARISGSSRREVGRDCAIDHEQATAVTLHRNRRPWCADGEFAGDVDRRAADLSKHLAGPCPIAVQRLQKTAFIRGGRSCGAERGEDGEKACLSAHDINLLDRIDIERRSDVDVPPQSEPVYALHDVEGDDGGCGDEGDDDDECPGVIDAGNTTDIHAEQASNHARRQ